MAEILNYMYSGKITLSQKNVGDILAATEYLEIWSKSTLVGSVFFQMYTVFIYVKL